MRDLTDRQRAVLDYIVAHKASEGWSPTLREIGKHFGVTHIAVVCHLRALEKKGAIERKPGSARAIRVTGHGVTG